MNEREVDLKGKLRAFETLKTTADPSALYEWAVLAGLALEFRETDAMIGLDEVDEKLVAKVASARTDALALAGGAGHEDAALEFVKSVWSTRDAARAEAAAKLALKNSSNAENLYLLGLFAFNGFGLNEDCAASLAWHRKAAEKGNAAAMFELYAMLSQGIGSPANPKEAVQWCHKSADGGYPRAMANLGGFYATGNGVDKDQALSLKWYAAAAELGHGKSAATLGVMYALGDGAAESAEMAKTYFAMADECGFDWRSLADACGVDPDAYED